MITYIWPPTSVSVSVPPIAYTVSGVNTPVTPTEPLPTYTPANVISKAKIDFATTNVSNASWVQVISSVGASNVEKAQIFMSSGEPLEFAFGGSGSEVSQGYIFPGGNGFQDLTIPSGTRVSVRAVNAVTVNSGLLLINFLG